MADYTFNLQNVEDEIIKRLGQNTDATILDSDNENRIIPMFWQSVTDIILTGEYMEEDISGLIDEKEETISGTVDGIAEIDLSGITSTGGNNLTLLRYHDVYSTPGDTNYLQKVIEEKSLDFMKQILGGDPRNDGEVYLYKVANKLKFFKDSSNDVVGKYINVVFVKSPQPLDTTATTNLLSTYSLGFIYKAIDLTVDKIKKERQ